MTYKREVGEVLHPDREPLSVLDELKAAMGSQGFSGPPDLRCLCCVSLLLLLFVLVVVLKLYSNAL